MIKIFFASLVLFVGAGAQAKKGFVEEKKWSKEQLTEKIKQTEKTAGISIAANDLVIGALQNSLSSQQIRRQMRESLKRMQAYEVMIDYKLKNAKLPMALKAVPLMESGYNNIQGPKSAGIWQFIPETAKKYGLKVNEDTDERFEEAKETDAVIKYYKELHKKFKDWPSVLLAYNVGEKALEDGLKKADTKDVWKALEKGQFAENKDYLPQMMAAIVIVSNPDLLK